MSALSNALNGSKPGSNGSVASIPGTITSFEMEQYDSAIGSAQDAVMEAWEDFTNAGAVYNIECESAVDAYAPELEGFFGAIKEKGKKVIDAIKSAIMKVINKIRGLYDKLKTAADESFVKKHRDNIDAAAHLTKGKYKMSSDWDFSKKTDIASDLEKDTTSARKIMDDAIKYMEKSRPKAMSELNSDDPDYDRQFRDSNRQHSQFSRGVDNLNNGNGKRGKKAVASIKLQLFSSLAGSGSDYTPQQLANYYVSKKMCKTASKETIVKGTEMSFSAFCNSTAMELFAGSYGARRSLKNLQKTLEQEHKDLDKVSFGETSTDAMKSCMTTIKDFYKYELAIAKAALSAVMSRRSNLRSGFKAAITAAKSDKKSTKKDDK